MSVSGQSNLSSEELEKEAERSRRLKLVLTKLLSPDFKASDDTLLEKLFSILQQQFNERNEKWKASDLGMYVPWLLTVEKRWKDLKKCVKVLALRLTGLTSFLKPGLKALRDTGLLLNLRTLVKADRSDPAILLGYSECLHSLIKNDPTCQFLLDTNVWRDVVDIAVNSSSLYTVKRGRDSTSLLCVHLIKAHSKEHCLKVLNLCFSPLKHRDYRVEVGSTNVDLDFEPLLSPKPPSDSILPAIVLAREIICTMLEYQVPPRTLQEIMNHYALKEWCWNIINDESDNVQVIGGCSKVLAAVNACSIVKTESKEVEYRVMRGLTLEALKQLNLTAQKHMFTLVLDVCLDYQTLWSRFGGPVSYSSDDLQSETYDLENNLIITQCMPLYICMKVTRVMESDVMDMFANKVFTLSCQETQRVCYTYRDCLREAPDRSLEALCLQAIRSFLAIPSCYTKREQAVMSFQCMMHTLKEFVPEEVNEISADCIVAKRSDENLVTRFPNILSSLLDGLAQFITTFKITWQDSLETVCILSFIQTLADKKNISPMLCAKALQLAKHVISQFIPPNLALLVDTLKGSSMESLGGLVHRKLADIHWEVRDSALELLLSIATIARAKFPAFQTLLVEKELAGLVVSLASTDPSYYVRCSALLCLSEMVKIRFVWDMALFDKRLLEQTLRTLLEDTEGIVRREAALLINQIYLHQVIPGGQCEKLMDGMCEASEKDLFGGVRLACLDFWTTVIEKSKSRQGMMDGEFPPIIFSAQKKKMITLDRLEIRTRLGHLLNDLSASGCLQILWMSLNDDCDCKVALRGKELVEKLIQLLDKYDAVSHLTKTQRRSSSDSVTACNNLVNITMSPVNSPPPPTKMEGDEELKKDGEEEEENANVDRVIEEIVSIGDAELVECLASCELRSHQGEVCSRGRPRTVLPPLHFLDLALSADRSQAEQRLQWIHSTSSGLESLLQDILCTDTSTNLVDCY